MKRDNDRALHRDGEHQDGDHRRAEKANMTIVRYLPKGEMLKVVREWMGPFPGSKEAQEAGCTCPEERQQLPGHQLLFDLDCPIHELERVPS